MDGYVGNATVKSVNQRRAIYTNPHCLFRQLVMVDLFS